MRRVAAITVGAVAVVVMSAVAAGALVFTADMTDTGRTEQIEALEDDGILYFRLSDLARTVSGARHWNPTTSKMTLAVGVHRISMFPDSQFVSLDDETVNVVRPVILSDGAYWVPSSFLDRALSGALNTDIVVDASTSSLTFRKLGALIGSVTIEDRSPGTAAVFALNERAEFTARSRNRGRIDVFVPGAALADSLVAIEGSGLIVSATAEQTEAGVGVVVSVAPSATSYTAEVRSRPYRLEIVVEAGQLEAIPPPILKSAKHLMPSGSPDVSEDRGRPETVIIDPGHGGTDAGRVSASGVPEKDITLALARDLSRRLQEEGFYVFMTRSSDSLVPVKRRAEIANLASADIFISIHCGSWHSGAGRGYRVSYYMPRRDGSAKTSGGGRGLRRNSHNARPAALDGFLWDDSQKALVGESRELARAVHGRLKSATEQRDRGVGGGDISVLAGCSMPAILVEPGYISNTSEAALLSDPGFRSDLARAIARGVVDYRDSLREEGH